MWLSLFRMRLPNFASLRRFFPVLAFFGGFVWDALTIGQRVKPLDFWRLGAFLLGAALIMVWLARRPLPLAPAGDSGVPWQRQARALLRLLPFLLLQFFFGGLFSALFILYFKSAGHLGSWLAAACLGLLLVGNEFFRDRYGEQFALTWAMFCLNATLLANFALPYALGSLDPRWFYVSTLGGALTTYLLWRFGAARHGGLLGAGMVTLGLLLAWLAGMIAPVPLVLKDVAVGHGFVQADGRYRLQVEPPAFWQPWRTQDDTVHVAEGRPLYAVSAVYAPLGIRASLEHRWEYREAQGWKTAYRNRFDASGGRESGFRGYSWVHNPRPGEWRFVVALPDGRTVAVLPVTVVRAEPAADQLRWRDF